jgi:hypothetical protein
VAVVIVTMLCIVLYSIGRKRKDMMGLNIYVSMCVKKRTEKILL